MNKMLVIFASLLVFLICVGAVSAADLTDDFSSGDSSLAVAHSGVDAVGAVDAVDDDIVVADSNVVKGPEIASLPVDDSQSKAIKPPKITGQINASETTYKGPKIGGVCNYPSNTTNAPKIGSSQPYSDSGLNVSPMTPVVGLPEACVASIDFNGTVYYFTSQEFQWVNEYEAYYTKVHKNIMSERMNNLEYLLNNTNMSDEELDKLLSSKEAQEHFKYEADSTLSLLLKLLDDTVVSRKLQEGKVFAIALMVVKRHNYMPKSDLTGDCLVSYMADMYHNKDKYLYDTRFRDYSAKAQQLIASGWKNGNFIQKALDWLCGGVTSDIIFDIFYKIF